jgi:hypothetical protein
LHPQSDYELIDPQVSVVTSKLGNADEASLAHCHSPAAVPKASLTEGDQSVPELMSELTLAPLSLPEEFSIEAEGDALSNRLSMNSRIPILHSRAACCVEVTVPRISARVRVIIRLIGDDINESASRAVSQATR